MAIKSCAFKGEKYFFKRSLGNGACLLVSGDFNSKYFLSLKNWKTFVHQLENQGLLQKGDLLKNPKKAIIQLLF